MIRPRSDYKCYCKSKRGRKMSYYDGDPKRYWDMRSVAPFNYGQFGLYCTVCKKVGLKKEEIGTTTTKRGTVIPKIITLIDILAEEEE